MKKHSQIVRFLLSCDALRGIVIPAFIESPFPFNVSQLQGIVECSGQLHRSDWAPANSSGTSSYPIWKHRLQAVLSQMKQSGDLWHDPVTHTYGLNFKNY